jgi:hypothetical protein
MRLLHYQQVSAQTYRPVYFAVILRRNLLWPTCYGQLNHWCMFCARAKLLQPETRRAGSLLVSSQGHLNTTKIKPALPCTAECLLAGRKQLKGNRPDIILLLCPTLCTPYLSPCRPSACWPIGRDARKQDAAGHGTGLNACQHMRVRAGATLLLALPAPAERLLGRAQAVRGQGAPLGRR